MPNFRILVKDKVVNIDAITARQACVEALSLEPAAKSVSILDNKGGRHALARFTRQELSGKAAQRLKPFVEGHAVTFCDSYQAVTLHCNSAEGAAMVARMIAAHAVKFSSKAE